MSNLVVFNNFKPTDLLRNRYLRREWAVWDANLHHGDIRPFACPELVCEDVPEDTSIYPVLRSCCCVTLPECTRPVKGFCRNQYFWVDPVTQTLRQSTEEELCELESCRAGAPVPEPIVNIESSCVGDNYDDEYRACIQSVKDQCATAKQVMDDAYVALLACIRSCEYGNDWEHSDGENYEGNEYCSELRTTWMEAVSAYRDCLWCLDYSGCQKQEPPCDAITMHYVITYVTRHSGIATESSPSQPSFAMTNGYIPNVTLTLPQPPPADYCIDAIRIYRVTSDFQDATSSMPIDGSEFVLVAEVPADTTTFVDDLETSETGYPLTTSHPMLNPAPQGVKYVDRTEDGLVVADDCRLYISASGEAQFGLEGVVSIEDKIRAVRAIGNKIFVLTDHYPVVVSYKHTDGIMTIDRNTIQMELPLRSKRSVSVYGSKLYFASEWSLYVWDTGGYGANINNAIHAVLTPDQWKMVDAGSVVGVAYDYGYMLHSKRLQYSLMFEFGQDHSDTSNQTSVMPISYVCMDDAHLDRAGHIWYRKGSNIYKWDWRRDVCDIDVHEPGRTPMCEPCCPFTLRLHYDSEGKNSFNWARLEWDNGTARSMQVTVYEGYFGTHTELGSYEVTNSRSFGICGYGSAQTHWVEIQGCGVVHEFRMATSNADLVNRSNQSLVGRE